MDKPTYLGDGLYASFDGYQVELFASDGERKTNSVFLDRNTLAAFARWLEQLNVRIRT